VLQVLPGSAAAEGARAGHVAPGAIAVGGAGGCCELLSRYGTQLAAAFPVGSED